jgi:hypothetical protein
LQRKVAKTLLSASLIGRAQFIGRADLAASAPGCRASGAYRGAAPELLARFAGPAWPTVGRAT